jgi:hypothetical protein
MKNNTYEATRVWRTGWTSQNAHYVIGMARSHGRARYMMVSGACGKAFNPGRDIDPTNIPDGVTLCGSCQAKLNREQPRAKAEQRLCTECGETNLSKSSPLCSFCREMRS